MGIWLAARKVGECQNTAAPSDLQSVVGRRQPAVVRRNSGERGLC
jgi:hypothetical protein